MHDRIAVDFRGRGLKDLCPKPLGESQHVDRTMDARLGGLHRIVLIVHRAGWTSEVVDLVDLDIERERHIVPHDLEARIADKMRDVVPAAR
jgi:hypothetical protein